MLTIYPDDKDIPAIYGRPGFLSREFKLLLLTDTEFLDLPLENLVGSTWMNIVLSRLSLLDKKGHLYEARSVDTINDLRMCKQIPKMLEWIQQDADYACLFSASQLAELLSEPGYISNQALIDAVLPKVNLTAAIRYTKERLAQLYEMPHMRPLLALLPPSHLRLLPAAFFASPHWKWTEENVVQVLLTDDPAQENADAIADTLTIDQILSFANKWSTGDLPLFSKKHLDPNFPWNVFVSKGRFGSWLKEQHDLFLKIWPRIDWELFVSTHQYECASLFSTYGTHNSCTARINLEEKIKALPIETVVTLAPIWEPKHLPYFSPAILKDEKFPWKGLVNQEHLGHSLKAIKENLTGIHFPWADLKQVDADILFALDPLKKAPHPLEYLDIDALRQVVACKHISYEHLDYVGDKHLANEKFPWEAFFTNQSFYYWLKTNFQWIPQVPLVDFARQNPTGFNKVFDFPGTYNAEVRPLLRLIPKQQLEPLREMGALQQKHFNLLQMDSK